MQIAPNVTLTKTALSYKYPRTATSPIQSGIVGRISTRVKFPRQVGHRSVTSISKMGEWISTKFLYTGSPTARPISRPGTTTKPKAYQKVGGSATVSISSAKNIVNKSTRQIKGGSVARNAGLMGTY